MCVDEISENSDYFDWHTLAGLATILPFVNFIIIIEFWEIENQLIICIFIYIIYIYIYKFALLTRVSIYLQIIGQLLKIMYAADIYIHCADASQCVRACKDHPPLPISPLPLHLLWPPAGAEFETIGG